MDPALSELLLTDGGLAPDDVKHCEALAEDSVGETTISEERRSLCWRAQVAHFQWLFVQIQRGLLPTVTVAGVRSVILSLFSKYRSFNRHWEWQTPTLVPEFVEWVEEQRAKAA